MCVYILYFVCGHRVFSLSCFNNGQVKRHGETARGSYGYRAVILRYPQPYIEIVRRPYGFRTALHGHYAVALRSPCESRTAIERFLFQNDHLKSCGCLRSPHGQRTVAVRCSYRRVYGLRAYDFYFRV